MSQLALLLWCRAEDHQPGICWNFSKNWAIEIGTSSGIKGTFMLKLHLYVMEDSEDSQWIVHVEWFLSLITRMMPQSSFNSKWYEVGCIILLRIDGSTEYNCLVYPQLPYTFTISQQIKKYIIYIILEHYAQLHNCCYFVHMVFYKSYGLLMSFHRNCDSNYNRHSVIQSVGGMLQNYLFVNR